MIALRRVGITRAPYNKIHSILPHVTGENHDATRLFAGECDCLEKVLRSLV